MPFVQSIPQTLIPPPNLVTKISCAPRAAFPADAGNARDPAQHAAKQLPDQDESAPAAARQ